MLPAPLTAARGSADPATLAFAGVISRGLQTGRRPLIRGIDETRFRSLADTYAPGLDCRNNQDERNENGEAPAPHRFAIDEVNEFDELVDLLLEHRARPTQPGEDPGWLACVIATAAMGDNHLWQDLGLPSRDVLSRLLRENFPTLAALNTRDMKWKKFFYRQLCERAGLMICKSPNCAECCDFRACFGPEEG